MPPRQPRPRGPSFGSKRLKPRNRPQRTGSVELSRLLEELSANFSFEEHMVSLPEPVQAELKAISERNFTGSWTPRDVDAVKKIYKQFIRGKKK